MRLKRMARRWSVVFAAAWLTAPLASLGQVKPEQSLKTFNVAKGLAVVPFAHEPMLANPTNIDVDAQGRVWVCEGVNYRRWSGLRPEGDRIVVLQDEDGDGKADKSTVFYQGKDVNSALGICVLGNKVIVSCSPNVFVFTDENGDLKADTKEVLFSGIGGVQHDHGAHAFVFGPDGKLYFNVGNDGGRIADKSGRLLVDQAGNETGGNAKRSGEPSRSGPYRQGLVFRCNVDGSEVETLAWNFRNNYEVNVDSFGTLWQSDNDDDGNQGVRINYVMEFGNYGYQDEFTGAGWGQKRTNMEMKNGQIDKPRAHWHQNDPGVIPNLLPTYGGSPTGICIYEGNLLPEVFRNQMIHCDAGPNVVRAYPVTSDGAGYQARIEDVIKGGDQWFRPSDVCVAPDGSLMVADWYDPGVGGHHMGDDKVETVRGRIFRVAPPGAKYSIPKLDLQSFSGAVDALKSPNSATRYLAWTALHQMGPAAEPELLKLWNDANPRFRARALHLLARIPGQADKYIQAAAKDQNPDLRVLALRITRSLKPDPIPLVRSLARDPSAHVRRECAIALRHSKSSEAPSLFTELALQHDGKDRWYLEALGVAMDRNEDAYFDAWLSRVGENWNTAAGRDIIWRSRALKTPALLARIIADPVTTDVERPRYFRAFDFLPGAEGSPMFNARQNALVTLLAAFSERPAIAVETILRLKGARAQEARPVVDRILDSAKGTPAFVELCDQLNISDRNPQLLTFVANDPRSQTAASALRIILRSNDVTTIEKGLAGKDADKLAIALGALPDNRAVELLTEMTRDQKRDEAIRQMAIVALGNSKAGGQSLIKLVKEGVISGDLLPVASRVLHTSTSREIREQAGALLPLPPTKDGQPLPPLAKLLQMKGDAARGKAIYTANCAQCHQVSSEGTNFGPALTEIGDKLGRDALFTSILYPSAGIEHNYEGHVVKVKGGDEVVGLLVSETADELILRIAGGIVTPIKKSQITARRVQKESIMPEDLQKGLTVQELVDLVDYLQTLKKK